MAQRTGRLRRKTRSKFRKSASEKGIISIRRYFQEFKEGEKVILKAEPAVQGGMYFRRFHGKVGQVVGKRGECYKVQINDANKKKEVIVHPVHLKKVKWEEKK